MKKLLVLGSIAAAAVVVIKKRRGSAETRETWRQVTDKVS